MIKLNQATQEDLDEALAKSLSIYHEHPDMFGGNIGRYHSIKWNDTLLGVVGIDLIWPGVAALGAVLTHHIYEHPVAFVRILRKLISFGMLDLNVHRVQMDVQTDYDAGHKMAKALGFEAEGIMKKFGPSKKDYTLYARVD